MRAKAFAEYPMYRDAQGSCPEAARASRELISLPLHLGLSDEDVQTVCTALRSSVREGSA